MMVHVLPNIERMQSLSVGAWTTVVVEM